MHIKVYPHEHEKHKSSSQRANIKTLNIISWCNHTNLQNMKNLKHRTDKKLFSLSVLWSLIVVWLQCTCSWRRPGGIRSGCTVLVTGLGRRPANHTELWNLGHSSPQACCSSFISLPKPAASSSSPSSLTPYSRKEKTQSGAGFQKFQLRFEGKYLEWRQLPEQLLKHELTSTYTSV